MTEPTPPNCFECKQLMRHDGDSQVGAYLVRHYSCEHCLRAAVDSLRDKYGQLAKMVNQPKID